MEPWQESWDPDNDPETADLPRPQLVLTLTPHDVQRLKLQQEADVFMAALCGSLIGSAAMMALGIAIVLCARLWP